MLITNPKLYDDVMIARRICTHDIAAMYSDLTYDNNEHVS